MVVSSLPWENRPNAARLLASCLDGNILAELGKTHEEFVYARSRIGRQGEVEDGHLSRSWR